MKEKILDMTLLAAFAVVLAASSDIQESAPADDANISAACEISANSFTTESGEETSVEKRDVVLVTASNDSENEQQEDLEEENPEKEDLEEEKEQGEAETAGAEYENRWGISLTDEEIDLLAKIVWLEANGEPVEGQEAVVEVVFNRMASERFPDALYDVLSQKNPVQFVSWKNRDKAQPTEKEYNSIYEVLNGNTNLLRDDTVYFSREPLTSNLDVKICCHSFCY